MENEKSTSKKNTFYIPYGDNQIQISGDFDSGNLGTACIDLQKQQIQLTFGKDKEFKPSSKTWFYFSLYSKVNIEELKLYFMRVNILSTAAKIYDFYRPVIKIDKRQWQRHQHPIDFDISPEGEVNFKMSMTLQSKKRTYIALAYPWSFTENQKYLESLQSTIKGNKDIYFNKQTLIFSPQNRPIHLISISSIDATCYPPEKYIQHLFPQRDYENHFRQVHKPLILITSRVHPGEIGSSYALIGMINYLLSDEPQAIKLRKQFYFMIIPMLNPDGVYNGNNRMDSLGQNLNRFYHLPDLQLQPSCYAVKSLIQNTRKQLFAFFDLHGHANKKSCFIFGNHISNPRHQIQSVLFAKYLSTICDYIEFKSCNFSKKQMSSRDKNQDMSKEGCARVVVHKWTNSPYCYTLQTGLFKNVKVDEKGIFRFGEKFYNPQTYEQVGAKMLISFSAILQKNKQIDEMRKFCADYVMRLQKVTSKKEKVVTQKIPKSIKSIKSEDNSSEQSSKKLLQQKQNDKLDFQLKLVDKMEKAKQVTLALKKNKGQLLNGYEDQDDQ